MAQKNMGAWLNVYMIYSNQSAGLLAFNLFQNVTSEVSKEFLVGQNMLRLDCLTRPELAEQARYDLREANLIVISIKDESELTEEFRQWALNWDFEPGLAPCLLAVLFGSNPGLVNGDEAPFLRSLARSHGLDFVSNRKPDELICDSKEGEMNSPIVQSVRLASRSKGVIRTSPVAAGS